MSKTKSKPAEKSKKPAAKAKAPTKAAPKKAAKAPAKKAAAKKPRQVKDAQKKSIKQTMATGQKKEGGKSKHAANKAGNETGLPNAVAKKKRGKGGSKALTNDIKRARKMQADILRLRNKPAELHAHLAKLAGSTKAGGASPSDLRTAAMAITGAIKGGMSKHELAEHIHAHVTSVAAANKKNASIYPKTAKVRKAIAAAKNDKQHKWDVERAVEGAKANIRRASGKIGVSKAGYRKRRGGQRSIDERITSRARGYTGGLFTTRKRNKNEPIAVNTSRNAHTTNLDLSPKRLNLILNKRGLSGKYTGTSAWKNSIGIRGGIAVKKK